MKPEKKKGDYEKVTIGEFVFGSIEDIQLEKNHVFKYKDNVKEADAVRFKFKLDDYKFPHYSRWMLFFYGEKTSLYNKYLMKLIEGANPDMDFDLLCLKGMRVKTLWAERGDFQNIENIFPEGEKVKVDAVPPVNEDDDFTGDAAPEGDEEPPF